MNNKFPIVGLLKHPILFLVFMGVGGGMFYINYYAMTKFPGTDGFQCLIGANFTPSNIVFSVLISIAAGLLAAGLVSIYKQKQALRSMKIGSASTVGLIIGTLTTFCTLCVIPTISLFGVGIGFGFITQYQIYFKAASLLLLGTGIYLLNRQLKGSCKICKY
jgi:hypothetical protein